MHPTQLTQLREKLFFTGRNETGNEYENENAMQMQLKFVRSVKCYRLKTSPSCKRTNAALSAEKVIIHSELTIFLNVITSKNVLGTAYSRVLTMHFHHLNSTPVRTMNTVLEDNLTGRPPKKKQGMKHNCNFRVFKPIQFMKTAV